jgi:hypothetical protein
MLFELEDYLVKAADLLRWADQADVKAYIFARGLGRVYGSRAVGRDFRSIGERASSTQSANLRRWGGGVGTPSGDSTTENNRPGANPPHTYVGAVPRKSRSPERVMPARTSRADCGGFVRP